MNYLISLIFISGLSFGTTSAQPASAPVNAPTPLTYYATTTLAPSLEPATVAGERPDKNRIAPESPRAPYKSFALGVYGGINTTRFSGEDRDGNKLSGRIGYQVGAFIRGGGRFYVQGGAEFFASSSTYFVRGDGATADDIRDKIDVKYLQIPIYVGFKLLESDRGVSAVRLQVGAEYANRLSSDSKAFNFKTSAFKTGTFNGLGQLGFDIGPLLIDLTYHYGFSNSIEDSAGFAGSKRRIVSASVGLKF